jgi:WD40 repeat protein
MGAGYLWVLLIVIKRLLALGVLALVIGVSARYWNVPTPAAADVTPDGSTPTLIPTGNSHLHWEPVWTQPSPHLSDVALAVDGGSVVWVDDTGSVRRIDAQTHRTLWQTDPLPGVNSVRIAPQGTVLAYSRMNPACTTVRILDATLGPRKSVLLPLQGAVWSAAITPDGNQAVIGTGNSLLYCFPLRQDAVFPGAPISLPGIPETVDVAAHKSGAKGNALDTVALLGTWQDGGVCAWGLDRLPRWRHGEQIPDYSYVVALSQDGSTGAAVAARGPHRESARLHVWDMSTGKLLFIENLHGFDPHIAVSTNGQQIAVTYSRADGQNEGFAPRPNEGIERKVMLFDRTGRHLFEEKGGVFFSPELIGISADGTRVMVRDPQGTIWTLDNHGRTIARLTAPSKAGQLLRVLTTRDGNYMLLYRGDGTLSLYHVVTT